MLHLALHLQLITKDSDLAITTELVFFWDKQYDHRKGVVVVFSVNAVNFYRKETETSRWLGLPTFGVCPFRL